MRRRIVAFWASARRYLIDRWQLATNPSQEALARWSAWAQLASLPLGLAACLIGLLALPQFNEKAIQVGIKGDSQ